MDNLKLALQEIMDDMVFEDERLKNSSISLNIKTYKKILKITEGKNLLSIKFTKWVAVAATISILIFSVPKVLRLLEDYNERPKSRDFTERVSESLKKEGYKEEIKSEVNLIPESKKSEKSEIGNSSKAFENKIYIEKKLGLRDVDEISDLIENKYKETAEIKKSESNKLIVHFDKFNESFIEDLKGMGIPIDEDLIKIYETENNVQFIFEIE